MGRTRRATVLIALTLLFGSHGAPPTSQYASVSSIPSQRFTVEFDSLDELHVIRKLTQAKLENYRERPKVSRASRSSERKLPAIRRCDSSCEVTKYERRNDLTDSQVKALIIKLARKYRVSETRALSIASCESGYDETNYNRNGCEGYGCAGVFQQHLKYWKERAARYGHRGASPFNPYANIDVSMQMARSGWGHWEDCL